jgi:hypothetical protein
MYSIYCIRNLVFQRSVCIISHLTVESSKNIKNFYYRINCICVVPKQKIQNAICQWEIFKKYIYHENVFKISLSGKSMYIINMAGSLKSYQRSISYLLTEVLDKLLLIQLHTGKSIETNDTINQLVKVVFVLFILFVNIACIQTLLTCYSL